MSSFLRTYLYTVDFIKNFVGKASAASNRYVMLKDGPIQVTAKKGAEKIMLKLATGFRRGDVVPVEVEMEGVDKSTYNSRYMQLVMEDLESQLRQTLSYEAASGNLLLQGIDIHDIHVTEAKLLSNLSETVVFTIQVHTH